MVLSFNLHFLFYFKQNNNNIKEIKYDIKKNIGLPKLISYF